MRKCPACGYLLFGEGDACKHCGAAVPHMVAAVVGASATPAAPPPPPPTAAPPPPVALPLVPAPAAPPSPGRAAVARDDFWTPPLSFDPPAATKPTRTSPRVMLALVCLVSMALGWIAFDHTMGGDPLPAGTSAFVSGQGVSYSSPDHTFDAQFPTAPTTEQRLISVSSASATLDLAQVQTDDYEIVAASMVLPGTVPADRVAAVLHDILHEGATAQGDKIESETQITSDGAPGIEVRASVSDGYEARFRVLISGTHVYLLGVHSKHATARLYDALVNSLVMH
jgi:hypothetical protein